MKPSITKRLTLFVLLVAVATLLPMVASNAQDFEYGEHLEAQRTFQDSTGYFIIKFSYSTEWSFVPATYPPGKPHYGAMIMVVQIVDGKEVQLCDAFRGQYIDGGCFEDSSPYLVGKAKELRAASLQKKATSDQHRKPLGNFRKAKP